MKKTATTIVSSVLALSVIAGCGGAKTNNEASSSQADAGKGEKVKLEFFQNKTEAKASFDELIKKFNDANPNITVTQVNPPDAETVLKTRVAKKDVPDIIGLGATDTFAQLSKSGLFADFSNDALVSNIQPSYVNMLKKLTGTDQLYGIPFTANASGVIYNKTMFKELGLTIPKTWDELIATAQKVKDAGKTPFYLTIKDSWTVMVPFNSLSTDILGIDFYEKRAQGAVKFDSAEFREVADKQLKLLDFGQKDMMGKGYNDGNTAFAKGESAMYLQGVWAIPEIKKANPNIDLGVFTLPATNDPAKNKVISGVDTLLTISKNSKHPEEAKKFIEFMLKPENVQTYIDEQKAFSAVKNVNQTDDSVQDLNASFASGAIEDFSDHYIPGAVKADTIIQSYLQKKDVDAYVKQFDTEWDKVASRK
ncbi:extracellular solute-binding protein [Paenibacillus doosanensis]|uniref:Multiple sugar-binding protein n=1 Tax=Paenibacillus konkukensis TaxID=2020716 RepID=A0ABY4RQQ5_9BACL|nr:MULTISPECIES: extracellular solute-binding protein [Paenibacillus]MCS7461419.1 extracellular solute-binding protein [Paenibacillus doosanensis]UQZ83692.1 Multiple sugar-binding protein precursor [Paenibacillus konkukensis]